MYLPTEHLCDMISYYSVFHERTNMKFTLWVILTAAVASEAAAQAVCEPNRCKTLGGHYGREVMQLIPAPQKSFHKSNDSKFLNIKHDFTVRNLERPGFIKNVICDWVFSAQEVTINSPVAERWEV